MSPALDTFHPFLSTCDSPGIVARHPRGDRRADFPSHRTENHLPPYIKAYDEFKAKGVDAIYCLASNDVFVMSAWGRSLHTADKVTTIADSSLAWLKATGLTQDLSHVGFGERAKRFALVVDDLKVSSVGRL